MKKMVIKTKNKKDFFELMLGLSKQRLELLWQIKTCKPNSIYDLSKLMKKSQPYIQKEIKFLTEKGLLALKKSKSNGRVRLKPEMNYSVLSFEMEFMNE